MPEKNTGATGTATKTNKVGDLRKALADPTPLYFAAGVIDKIREVAPERLSAVKDKAADPKSVQERFAQQAKQTQSRLTSALSGIDTDLKKLREQAQHLAFQGLGLAAEYAVKAREGYGELAERGRGAVQTWRGEKDGGEGGGTAGKAAGRAPLASRHRGEAVVVEAGGTEEKPRPKMGGTRQGTTGRAAARTSGAGRTADRTADKTTAETADKTAAKPTPKTVAKKTAAKKTAAKKTTSGKSAAGRSAAKATSKSTSRTDGRSGKDKAGS